MFQLRSEMMTDELKKPASKIYIQKTETGIEKSTERIISVESQTNKGALELLKKVKKEME